MTQKMKVCKTKKTTTVCKSLSPSFNQSFDFKLTEKSLSQTFLTLHLKQVKQFPVKGRQYSTQHYKISTHMICFSDVTLGSIILGSAMFSRGSGLRQWNRVVVKHKEKVEGLHLLNMSGGGRSSLM